jgi:Tol biopolymer transport system component
MAAPFDPRRLAVGGTPVPVQEGVLQSLFSGVAQYSFSSNGSLVYVPGGIQGGQSTLAWVDRKGAEQPLKAAAHAYRNPRISPDGRRMAVEIDDQGPQVWTYDLSRETLTRLTFQGSYNGIPEWTPDGKRIAFQSNSAGPQNLFWQPSDGSGGPERLTSGEVSNPSPNSFSSDGQWLIFSDNNTTTSRDIWVLRLSDPSAGSGQGRKAQPFLKTPADESAASFSPDQKWLAYSSDESGRREIYVQPYPGPGGKWQISTDGGQEPVWNPNGRELFYRSGSKIMAVDVNQSRDREGAGVVPTGFSAGTPRMLFEGPYLPTPGSLPNYDVSPDGQRFLMVKPTEQEAAATQIHVVLNWFEELKRRVPVGR